MSDYIIIGIVLFFMLTQLVVFGWVLVQLFKFISMGE